MDVRALEHSGFETPPIARSLTDFSAGDAKERETILP